MCEKRKSKAETENISGTTYHPAKVEPLSDRDTLELAMPAIAD